MREIFRKRKWHSNIMIFLHKGNYWKQSMLMSLSREISSFKGHFLQAIYSLLSYYGEVYLHWKFHSEFILHSIYCSYNRVSLTRSNMGKCNGEVSLNMLLALC